MAEDFPTTNVTKKFCSTSRYKDTDIYQGIDENYYYGVWAVPTIEEQTQDIYYTVQVGEVRRLDKIAQTVYNNYLLWWVIAVANNILDPFTELEVGLILRIPYLPYIYSQILT